MRKTLLLALMIAALSGACAAQCSSTSLGGGYTCVGRQGGFTSGTIRNQTISVTSGDAVLFAGFVPTTGSTLSLTDSGSCTGSINTLGGSFGITGAVTIFGLTKATSTGTCTISMSWSGSSNSLLAAVWDIQGWNGFADVTSTRASVTGTTNNNCPSVTTTQNGDLILCMMIDGGNNNGTFTAVSPFALTSGNNSMDQEFDVQSSSGSIQPKFSYSQSSTFAAVTVALESSTLPPPATFAISAWNGIIPAGNVGGFNRWNGAYINPATTFLGSFDGQTTPTSALQVQNTVDMSGGSNGVQPTTTTLGNSTHGTSGTSWNSAPAAAMTYSNSTTFGSLPEPVVAGGTVYGSSGTLSLHCASTVNAGGTATSCGSGSMNIPSPGASVSAGFWFTSPNCNGSGSQDCGAMGILTGGTDYINVHLNGIAGSGNCSENGLFVEGHGGNSVDCLPYTNGATYRINGQENTGHAAVTVTFTNGSAVISATNSLAANQAIKLTTTGSLPTNFNLQISKGTYTSGITVTGAVGTTCFLTSFNGGGSGAIGLLYVSNANTMTSGNGISWVNLGSGYTSAPTSATASSGTATCSGTATISTTLATPILFVSSTGLSASQFELAATQGGTPIVAGSAGSGTHTATQYNVVTICQVQGSTLFYLGTMYSLSDTGASTASILQPGVSGEGPTTTGYDFYWGGYVVDNTGKISLTQCIL